MQLLLIRGGMLSSPRLLLPAVVIAAAALSACGSSSSSSSLTTTAPTPTVVTETFNGSITQGGTAVFSFTVNNSGYSLLAGYTSLTPGSVTALGMGIGAWDPTGQTCGLNQTQNVAGAGSTALSSTAGAGAFCVRVFDAGNIPSADVTATFTLQVQHY